MSVKKVKCVMFKCKGKVKESSNSHGSVFSCDKCGTEWFEPREKEIK